MSNQFTSLAESLNSYFRAYGGWKAVRTSPMTWLSVIITALNYHRWISSEWIDLTYSLVPSLLGFSLGTYSILFSIVTARMRRTMSELKGDTGDSYLAIVNSTFFHFIFVQILAMMWAMVFDSHLGSDLQKIIQYESDLFSLFSSGARYLASYIGFFLLTYSFLLTLSAALAVYGLATLSTPPDDN